MSQLTRIERLAAFLKSLGTTSTEIAERLRRWGIKGRSHSSTCCPISVVISAKFRGVMASVGPNSIMVYHEIEEAEWLRPVPDAIQDFIYAFDRGLYPDLVNKR